MRISELLAKKDTRNVISISPDQSLLEMARVLSENRIGAVLVLDEHRKLVGIASERDIVKKMAELGDGVASCLVHMVMTRSVISCAPEDSVITTLAIMNKNNIRHLPVVVNGEPLTMLSIREFDIACQHLEALSYTDELTGLPNRRFFMGALDREMARQRRTRTALSVAMLDLDHFKQVNDEFGHEIGDQALRHLAEILKGRIRGADVVGRLGGEEFGLVFPDTKLADAVTVCKSLLEQIRKSKVATSAGPLKLTASFGVAELDEDCLDPSAALIVADRLLYEAKADGRDRIASWLDKQPAKLQPSYDDVCSLAVKRTAAQS